MARVRGTKACRSSMSINLSRELRHAHPLFPEAYFGRRLGACSRCKGLKVSICVFLKCAHESQKAICIPCVTICARKNRSDACSAATPMSVSAARKATTTALSPAARSADRHREPPSLILQPAATSNMSLAKQETRAPHQSN